MKLRILTKKIKEFISAFRYVPKLFRLVYQTDKLYLFYLLCETICFALMPYPSAFLVKYAFDALEGGTPFSQFAVICAALILAGLLISVLKSYFNSIRPGRTSLLVGRLYNAFHKKSMEMDYELLAEKETQELQSFVGVFIKRKLSGAVWNFVSLFSSLIVFIISCILLLHIHILLAAAVLLGLLLNSFLSMIFISIQTKLDGKIILLDRYIKYFEETAVGEAAAKDIRIFQMGHPMKAKAEAYIQDRLKTQRVKKCCANIQGFLSLLNSHGIDFIIYAVLGYSVLQHTLSIGTFSLAVSNIILFRSYFQKISSVLVGYSETAKYIDYYNRFLGMESKFRKTGTEPIGFSRGDSYTIEFRDVSFRYPGQTDYALQHFNLTVHNKEKIAIAGENGAGKSTFVKLLMRLYDPTEGAVFINGIDIKRYDYDQYLSLFAPIFQDYKLFAFTLEENISSFDEAPFDSVRAAAEKGGIADRIEQCEYGYDTYLTKLFDENGIEFSGGEQQKIALARTYFKTDAQITILDEPASAMDARAEYQLYQRFHDLIGDNTAFFISHRLSSALFCDKILVIRDKGVCEYGSHAELMAQEGYYYQLFQMQSEYYL